MSANCQCGHCLDCLRVERSGAPVRAAPANRLADQRVDAAATLEPGVRATVQMMMEVISQMPDPTHPAVDGATLLTWAVALDQATGRPRYALERTAPDANGETVLQVIDRGEQPSLIITPGHA